MPALASALAVLLGPSVPSVALAAAAGPIPSAWPALAAGLAGAAVGAASPRLARIALAGGRPASGLPSCPLDPLPGLGGAAAVIAALVTGILAAAVVAVTPSGRVPLALVLVACAPALALADLAAHRLPDRATGAAALAAAALALATGGAGLLLRAVPCGLGAFLLLALLQAATRGGVGSGDVKLAGVIGLALGQAGAAQVALGLAAGTLLGGVAATALLVGGPARASSAVPFGPWLLLGALLVAGSPATLTGAHG
jgi:leader peptidase (prepilin peptidase)/N-methyltransferase